MLSFFDDHMGVLKKLDYYCPNSFGNVIKTNIDPLSGVFFVGLKNLEDWGSKIWISKINAFGPNDCLNLLMKRVFGKPY